ncbi:MAG: MarC family protein [Dehalococcoidales bacterium]|nr:MarC family protein [Dehalococcoidales bacterium]
MVTDSIWQNFLLTFVPLFIVIDAVGNLPFVISLSDVMSPRERTRMIRNAVITATVLGFFFLFLGQLVLNLMGISVGSFAIGGGIILLVLSVNYMMGGQSIDMVKEEMVAVVPIGTPLTMGPAAITTLLLLVTQFPVYYVVISFILNLLIVYVIFISSNYIIRFLGKGGVKAISKISSLLLAAIAVNMIIRGLDLLGILDVPAG